VELIFEWGQGWEGATENSLASEWAHVSVQSVHALLERV